MLQLKISECCNANLFVRVSIFSTHLKRVLKYIKPKKNTSDELWACLVQGRGMVLKVAELIGGVSPKAARNSM